MKQTLIVLTLLVLCNTGILSAQTIKAAEYFIDTDPGVGQGTVLPNFSPKDTVNIDFDVDITGLTLGEHNLYVRFIDSDNQWSIAHRSLFFVEQPLKDEAVVTNAEYFIDTDPGVGQATALPNFSPKDTLNIDFDVDISGLTVGEHNLYVRFIDSDGQWGITHRSLFFIEQPLKDSAVVVNAEYFIDTDPGVGQGTALPNFSPKDTVNIDFDVDISGLTVGEHNFYVRFIDSDGQWGIAHRSLFFIEQPQKDSAVVINAEYFIDTDPGVGQATALPNFSPKDTVDVNFDVDISGLTLGEHNLYVRFKDSDSQWGIAHRSLFFIEESTSDDALLSSAEYFIDTDPGLGQGITLPNFSPADTIDIDFDIDVTNLTVGEHNLYVRFKDSDGQWGNYQMKAFEIKECTPSVPKFEISANNVCPGSTINFTDSSTEVQKGSTYSWDFDGDGTEDATTVGNESFQFNKAGEYKATLKIVGADGCDNSTIVNVTVENDSIAPVADKDSLLTLTADCEITELVQPTATDNCGTQVTVTNDAVLPITENTTITWTFTDIAGNKAIQTQEVIIKDLTTPIPDLATLLDVNGDCEVIELVAPTATDNCNGKVTITNDATLPITENTTITWTYIDASGNSVKQPQNVILKDAIAPTLDASVLDTLKAECEITKLVSPTATDNCSGEVIVTNDVKLPITANTTITWTFTDGAGNSVEQTQSVIIKDATAPTLDANTLDDLTGECEITELTKPTATDNCSEVTVTNDVELPITTSTTITWTFTDGAGNSVEQTQNVIIKDEVAPIPDVSTLDDLTAECEITTLTSPTATDNCNGKVIVTNDVKLPITTNTTITWTFTDGAGNSVEQTQKVIINDKTAPIPNLATLPDVTSGCKVIVPLQQ